MSDQPGRLVVGCLGPLELTVDGRPVDLTTGRLRTVLVALALSAGKVVPMDRLVTAVWGDEHPLNARSTVQTYVARLRGALGAGSILVVRSTGYRLRVDPDDVDVVRFGRLLDQAEATGAAEPLAAALALWRGRPFQDARSAWLQRSEAPRLVERYLVATERQVDMALAGGWYAELLPRLNELAGQHPLRESLWARLLAVLDRCGRTPEALERYETIRDRINRELGIDPGPELQQIQDRMEARLPGGPPPRQLPAGLQGFTGRRAALEALDEMLDHGDEPMPVALVTGTAGVGKTALAVHWANRVAERFPDGQLYLNLRSFDPSGRPMSPAEAMRAVLDALRVAPDRVPAGIDAQTVLCRRLLAGRRLLLVLDNVGHADQIRPVLAGTPGCLVVVTSRNQLPDLGARSVVLDLLTGKESRRLLAGRLGADRIAAEPAAVARIVELCAGLPLALAIASARAAIGPQSGLDALAAELSSTPGRLEPLSEDDPLTDVRAVLSWSYLALSGEAARLFRLLGVHPGPDVAAAAAASLAALPLPRARSLLTELHRAHLVDEQAPGRYAFHDLLRAYAAELAEREDSADDRQLVVRRMLDYYLHTAYAAAMQIAPSRDPITIGPIEPAVIPDKTMDLDSAMAWYSAERPVLLRLVDMAATGGFDTRAVQLGWALRHFFDRQGHWDDQIVIQQAALAAADRSGDPRGESHAHRALGRVYALIGRYAEAASHLEQARQRSEAVGDTIGVAHSLRGLVHIFERQRRYPEAIDHCERAIAIYRDAGHRAGEAGALNALGWCHAMSGDYQRTITYCHQALPLLREVGNRNVEAATWDSLGLAYHHLGRAQEAIDCYRQAIELHQQTGDRYEQAATLIRLGDTHRAAGDIAATTAAWRQGLTLLEALGHPDAAAVRAKLAGP